MVVKSALITGISGQDGSYLANFLLKKGYSVYGIVKDDQNVKIYNNLSYFGIQQNIKLLKGNLENPQFLNDQIKNIKPLEIYNLAAFSSVGKSWSDPILTAKVSGLGALNLLEAVKNHSPDSKIYQASTSEMFGNSMDKDGFQREATQMKPLSPNGLAKLFAHNSISNYREAYGLFACSGILFNHESPIRGIDFVTRKITDGVAKIYLGHSNNIELGNLEIKRDWGFAGDFVESMWLMLQQNHPNDYVIATGKNSSIKDIVQIAFEEIGIYDWSKYLSSNKKFLRPAETFATKGDFSKAKKEIGWEPKTTFEDVIKMMVRNDIELQSVRS
tara:strand:- start:75 stop:1064 length:990 start_codon:yes stop_codon:yes gene_type:complete